MGVAYGWVAEIKLELEYFNILREQWLSDIHLHVTEFHYELNC